MTNNLIVSWASWHFYEAPKFILGVWKNYIQFSLEVFSTPLLLKTFFSPWRKYNWSYPRGLDVGRFFETLISNFFSRFLGALMRTCLIIGGALLQLFILVAGLVVFLLWIFLPIVCIIGLSFSLSII